MGFLKAKVEQSTARYPATAVVRNYLNSSGAYRYRTTEVNDKGRIFGGLTIYRRGSSGTLFSMSAEGDKNMTMERLFKAAIVHLEGDTFVTQGTDLDLAIVEDKVGDDKKVNVIISGAEEEVVVPEPDPVVNWLLEWSSSEPYFDFSKGAGNIMGRWFPMDTVRITTSDSPNVDGGLKKVWKIPEDLIANNFKDINILPIRGFVYGRYALEFKIVLQANPFQAGVIMLGTIPNPYGLTTYRKPGGVYPISSAHPEWYPGVTYGGEVTYVDFKVAVQRPNVMIDINSGGSGTLTSVMKYNKTLVRNFDFGITNEANPGVRGSFVSGLTLHVVSPLVVGTSNENHFDVRVFYRFTEASLTAMTETISQLAGATRPEAVYYSKHAINVMRNVKKNPSTAVAENAKFKVQGGVLGVIGAAKTAIDVASDVIGVVENIGTSKRKGFGTRNRDKPNDLVSNVRNNPRPRANFNTASGADDAVLMAVHWDELTEFFEFFSEEPKSFKDLISISGYLTNLRWSGTAAPGTSLMRWNPVPTVSPNIDNTKIGGNVLDSPLAATACNFTNYYGTMEMYFQFVKTAFHKGAIEVSINFGRNAPATGLQSSYVKVFNVQECAGFKVTIPYIYDTPVHFTGGTSTTAYLPDLNTPTEYGFEMETSVNVTVMNELVAPTSVSQDVNIIVWIRGGTDFGYSFPRPSNNLLLVPRSGGNTSAERSGLIRNPRVRGYLATAVPQPVYQYDSSGAIVVRSENTLFQTQGDDFTQRSFTGNRQTSGEHMDFKDILKTPVKILSNYPVEAVHKMGNEDNYKDMQNYLNLPVAPISTTLVQFLDEQYYSKVLVGTPVPSNKLAVYGNVALQTSIQHQILRCFGMYRGSLNYTIVIDSQERPVPIYYTYLTHDYALRGLQDGDGGRIVAMVNETGYHLTWRGVIGIGDDIGYDPAFNNMYNGFILPSVNPSEKISIPHSMPNNWLTMNRRLYSRFDVHSNIGKGMPTMRENSEWFNGTLRLWSTAKFKVTVYLNSGDDHELGGFLGMLPAINPYAQFALRDQYRNVFSTQGLDFKFGELTRIGWNSVKDVMRNTVVASALGGITAVCAGRPEIASVTGALVLFSACGGMASVAKMRNMLEVVEDEEVKRLVVHNLEQIGRIPDGVAQKVGAQLTNACNSAVDDVTAHGVQMMEALIKQFFPTVDEIAGYKDKVWVIAQNLVHVCLSKSWTNGAWAIFSIFVEFGIFEFTAWKLIGTKLSDLVASMAPNAFVTEEAGAWEAVVEVICTIIFGKLQMQNCGGAKPWLNEIFKFQNYKNVTGINGLLNIVRNLMRCVRSIWDWAVATKDPNIALFEALQKQDTELGEFMEDANLYLTAFNDSDLKKKHNRMRFLHTIMRALKLRLVLLKINQPRITGQLLAFCNEVIKKADRQRYLLKCDVVKAEPFVLCLEGKSNIGKSFSVMEISTRLLESIGYKHSNPDVIFTIPSGVDYWNGYDDQPVVWYDDWCNLSDETTMRAHISQLYGLKTSAVFNVPRAELENKEQIAVPHIVVLTTNNPFPRHPMFVDENAVYRRRDLLVKLRLKGDSTMESYSREALARYDHLEMVFYPNSTSFELEETVYSFDEGVARIQETFIKFHQKELLNKEAKYTLLCRNVKQMKVDSIQLANPFEILTEIELEEESLMTTERLTRRVEELVVAMNEQFVLKPDVPSDEEVFTTQGLVDEFGRIIVQKTTDLRAKVHAFYRKLDTRFYRCSDCGCKAAMQTGIVVCTASERKHYFCFMCTARKRKHEGKYMCDEHECEVSIEDYHWQFALVGEILGEAVYAPESFLSLIEKIYGDETHTNKAKFAGLWLISTWMLTVTTVCAASYARTLWRLVFYAPWAEGNDTEPRIVDVDDSPLEEFVPIPLQVHETYTEKGAQMDPKLVQNCNLFYVARSSGSKGTKYICPHSVLDSGYAYADGSFFVNAYDGVNTFSAEIPDIACLGKCVLRNARYLGVLSQKHEIPADVLDAYEHKRYRGILKSVPRFALPADHEKVRDMLNQYLSFTGKPWWQQYISPIGDFFVRYGKLICTTAMIGAMLWGLGKMAGTVWAWIGKAFGIDMDVEAFISSDPDTSRKTRRERRKDGKRMRTQGMNPSLEDKVDKLCANYVVLSLGSARVVGWGLCNTTLMLPLHQAFIFDDKSAEIQVDFPTRPHEGFTHSAALFEVVNVPGKDLCMVQVLRTKILFKNCRSIMNNQPGEVLKTDAILIEVDALTMDISDVPVTLISRVHNATAVGRGGEVYRTDAGWMYDYQRKGACGSILVVDDVNPILCMHVSGMETNSRGIGVDLYSDLNKVQGEYEFPDSGEDTVYYGDDCNLQYLASVPSDMTSFVPNKTNIVPSLISQHFPHESTVRPAILDGRDEEYQFPRPPLYYGVRKNGMPTEDFSDKHVEWAYRIVSDMILSNKRHLRTPTVLSVEEAVMGLPIGVNDDEETYYGSIPLDTSAGWPYNTPHYQKKYNVRGTTKKDWLRVEHGEAGPVSCEVHPQLLAEHAMCMKLREDGLLAPNVFQDCLKDEKRKHAKALAEGGTRLISASNVEGTIALRRYTLDFTSHIKYNRITNGIAVGINPESPEWTVLAQTLRRNSENMFSLDFSNFGAGLNYIVGLKFGDLVIDYYKGALSNVHTTVVRTLVRELMGSVHIAGNLLYRTCAGSPSGAAVTVEMNSFVHLMYAALSWRIIGEVYTRLHGSPVQGHSKKLYPDLNKYLLGIKSGPIDFSGEAFRSNVVCVVYGDDGLYSVTNEYRELFNAYTINLVLKEHGIGVTDASKSANIMSYGVLEEMTFLKRAFVPNELLPTTHYMAKMEWASVEECVRWIHKKPLSPGDATSENCLSSLHLAWGHGSEAYNAWKNKLDAYLTAEGLPTTLLEWEDIAVKFFTGASIHNE